MPYDEHLADRIGQTIQEKNTDFSELKMIGGLCFKGDEKMLCGLHIEEKLGTVF
jgi:hypothetical protein